MMKLRSTTPVSISSKAKRAFLIFTALVVVGAGVGYVNRPVSADQYDDRIRALQADMNRYQAEANRLSAEAVTLANTLAQIVNQKNAIQAQIDANQAQYDKLVIDIASTEKQIKDNQDALGTTIADLYVDDTISPVEMLASSQNIGDFLDKQEYRNSVKDELGATIKKVKDLKIKLTSQKEEVTRVLAEQTAARDDLRAKESEQASILAQTQNDENRYQGMIASSKQEIAKAQAAQAAMRARANATGGQKVLGVGRHSAYESIWAGNCWMGGPGGWYSYGGADGNGGDGRGYGCRQCASYAAWKVLQVTGKQYKWGNGGSFARNAINAGYTNLGRNPQPNSLAVMWGDPGHVAWVEEVSGNQVRVTQYNYQVNGQYGMYSDMWLSVNFFDQYVKID